MWSELVELWRYRSLLRMLVVRDLKARYRSSLLGVAWSLIQPLGMMLVMTLAFTVITPVSASMRNPHLFILSGILSWNFFSAALTTGTASVVSNANLVKKVYFPRTVLPISATLSALVNYLLSLPVFIGVALLSGQPLHATLLLVPLAALLQLTFCVGFALMLGTLNVFYRDTAFILEVALLALFFLTPVFYDISQVAAQPVVLPLIGVTVDAALWLRRLNPMASMVNIYQELMYWGRVTDVDFWLRTAATAVVLLAVGFMVFRRFSPRFAEEV